MVSKMFSKPRIVLYAIIFAVIWSVFVTTQATTVEAYPSIIQFFAVSFVGYLIPSIILGISINHQPAKRIAGAFFFGASIDLLLPPLLVGMDGSIITSAILSKASVDVFVATLWQAVIPTSLLFYFVYPISFVIMMSAAVYLLTDQNLYNMMKG